MGRQQDGTARRRHGDAKRKRGWRRRRRKEIIPGRGKGRQEEHSGEDEIVESVYLPREDICFLPKVGKDSIIQQETKKGGHVR